MRPLLLAAVASMLFASPSGAETNPLCAISMRQAADAAHLRDFGAPISNKLIQSDKRQALSEPSPSNLSRAFIVAVHRVFASNILTMRWVYSHPTISAEEAMAVGEHECYRAMAGKPWG